MQEIVAVKGRRVFCLVERVGAPTPEQLYPERLTVRLAFATYVVNVNYNWEIILLEDIRRSAARLHVGGADSNIDFTECEI